MTLRDTSLFDALGEPNFNLADQMFVYDYNGNAVDNPQVFYLDRAPSMRSFSP
jgi:hypothetical protein